MRVRGDDIGRGNRDPLWPLIAQNLFLLGQQRPLLLFILGLFKQTSLQILGQINEKKCPSSLQHWDSNPRPLE